MPILKQSPVSDSKKRPRLDRAMISAPLGDFRHTMHVGRGGDAFGDTSFLSSHGGAKVNGRPPEPPPCLPVPRRSSGSFDMSPPGGGDRLLRHSATESSGGGYGLQQRVAEPPCDGFGVLHGTDSEEPRSAPDYSEPFFSFQLDLGPSILDEVLGVMDKDWGGKPKLPQEESVSPGSHHDEEDEDEEGQTYSFEDDQDEEIGL